LREMVPHSKIILMSGRDDAEHVAREVASRACAFVSKGRVGDLRATVNAVIRTILAQQTSEEFVGHGMATFEDFRSVGIGVS
jgi:hypothetical protein